MRKTRWPKGEVRLYRDDVLIYRTANLVVNAAAPAMANLAAGASTGHFISAVGFGSGTAAPAVTDTDLGAAPKYYNAVGGSNFPGSGEAQFSCSLSASDYAAVGMTVTEMGLFANSSSIALPASVGAGIAAWAAGNNYTVGALVTDSNGGIEQCTTAGESGGAAPTWATAIGANTTDGNAAWTLIAIDAIPQPLWAHALVSPFAFTGESGYTLSWTISF